MVGKPSFSDQLKRSPSGIKEWGIAGRWMRSNCVLFVADLFLFCYERDFMLSFSDDIQSDVI